MILDCFFFRDWLLERSEALGFDTSVFSVVRRLHIVFIKAMEGRKDGSAEAAPLTPLSQP